MMGRDDCRWNVSVSTDDGGNWLGASPSRVLGSEPRWSALLPIGPFVEPEVTSADTERDGRLREVAVTGALQVTFPPVGRAVRYASVGGGYVQVSGELPSSGVVGTYRFRICGEHLFEQVDAVTLRSASDGGTLGPPGADDAVSGMAVDSGAWPTGHGR